MPAIASAAVPAAAAVASRQSGCSSADGGVHHHSSAVAAGAAVAAAAVAACAAVASFQSDVANASDGQASQCINHAHRDVAAVAACAAVVNPTVSPRCAICSADHDITIHAVRGHKHIPRIGGVNTASGVVA